MTNSNRCSQCGAELTPGLPPGVCGQCLITLGLKVGLADETPDDEFGFPTANPPEASPSGSLGRIGDYELLEEIARGGMGVVYKARQTSLGRLVAVKMILAGQFVEKRALHRFKGEVITSALLQHPNIVAVHEIGMHAGQPFFSMDYVDGQNLAQLVGNRPLPAKKAAQYIKLLAEAIEYAHSQGILHRDLKPSNVLVDAATDQPRLTDFGLAKRLDSDSSLTVTGQILGSVNFIPPEQASPRHGKVGRHSDVYGLGAILYHLLTARAPFQAESLPTVVSEVLNTDPVPPRLLNSSVPRDLETICLKCLEKEPVRRYATAKGLADDLGRFLAEEPVLARPVNRPERLWRWCRRKPTLATLCSLVVLLFFVVLVGGPIAILRINHALAEAKRDLYAADMRQAAEALQNGAIDQVQEVLDRYLPQKGSEDLRGFEWRYYRHASDQRGLVVQELQGVNRASFDPELTLSGGILYNTAIDRGEALAWNTATWNLVPLRFSGNTNYDWCRWYPAEQAAVTISGNKEKLTVFQLPALTENVAISLPGRVLAVAVSRVSRFVAAAVVNGQAHRIQVWDLASGELRWSFDGYQGNLALRFSPDGAVLMVAYADGQAALWSVTTGKALPSPGPNLAAGKEDWELPPFFGPESRRLFLKRGEGNRLEAWDWSAAKLTVPYQARHGRLLAFALSADGALLALAGSSDVIALLDTKNLELIGEIPAEGAATITALAFSPSGKWIASATHDDRTAQLWDVKTRRQLAVLGGNNEQVCHIVFTPDEKSLITTAGDGKIKVWDLEAVLKRDLRWCSPDPIAGMVLSADGRVAAIKDRGGDIHLWDVARAAEIRKLPRVEPNNGAFSLAMALSPKGDLFAWANWQSLGIIDCVSGHKDVVPLLRRYGFCNPAFSSDGRELAFANATNIVILDVTTRKMRSVASFSNPALGLAVSSNGLWMATVHAGGALILWSRESGQQITNMSSAHPPEAYEVQFSSDSRLLATGGADGTAKIWDLGPGGLRLRHTLRGHVGAPSLVFSPDGRRVVSSSGDNALNIWDTQTGLEVGTIYAGSIVSFRFTPDGNGLYSASEDGEVRLWSAPPLAQLDRSVDKSGSNELSSRPMAKRK